MQQDFRKNHLDYGKKLVFYDFDIKINISTILKCNLYTYYLL